MASSRKSTGRHSFTAAGKISAVSGVYNQLETKFRCYIKRINDTKGKGYCLLQLLTLPEGTHVLTPLLEVLLNYYEKDDNAFIINNNRMNITLEYVLYVTGLPIKGKAVISDKNRDPRVVSREFGLPDGNKVTYALLKEIVRNEVLPDEKRLVALLALVVASFICPTSDGNSNLAAYLQFVEKPDEVNDYAWGAALLVVLYCKLNEDSDGNFWVLLMLNQPGPFDKKLERSRAKKKSKAAARSPEVVNDAEQMQTNATSSRHVQSTGGPVHLCFQRPATTINEQSVVEVRSPEGVASSSHMQSTGGLVHPCSVSEQIETNATSSSVPKQMETHATSPPPMQSTRGLVHPCYPRPATAINGQSLVEVVEPILSIMIKTCWKFVNEISNI